MPAELFVDTSAWYPLVDRGHTDHDRVAEALRVRIRDGATVVSTNLVLAESQVLIMRRIGRDVARTFLSNARSAPNRVVYSTRAIEERAEEAWLRRFADQDFSLVDAVSFAVMAERGIPEALTLDRHFEIAGFATAP